MRNISLRNSIIICKFAAAKSKLCSIRSDLPPRMRAFDQA